MKYSIQLNVPLPALEAAERDILLLCGQVRVEPKYHEGTPYYAVTGEFEGDARRFKVLQFNWSTFAHEGDPLFGVVGFSAKEEDTHEQ